MLYYKFESVMIMKSSLTKDEAELKAAKYRKLFIDWSAAIKSAVEVNNLGKKNLAYDIKGNSKRMVFYF